MNKFILFGCLALIGCGGKPKLEAPLCPDITKGGQAINEDNLAPVVSDDGRFTYLKFGMGQEVPNISALRYTGEERVVDHNFNPETRIATVFGVYPTIVLRAEKRVACIRNMQYDPRSPQARNTIAKEDGAIW